MYIVDFNIKGLSKFTLSFILLGMIFCGGGSDTNFQNTNFQNLNSNLAESGRMLSPPFNYGRNLPKYVPDEVLIKFKIPVRLQDIQNIVPGLRVFKNYRFHSFSIWRMKIPPHRTVEEILNIYRRHPLIEYIEPNFYAYAVSIIPNDPNFNQLWFLHNWRQTGGTPDADMDAPEAWTFTTGSTDIIVAVIDTGVDYNHEDLYPNMWTNPYEIPGNGIDDDNNGYVDDIYGINAINGSGNPMDDNDHGTHVAGIIGAVGNNGKGVVGVSWKVKIIACKFLSSSGPGTIADAIECLQYILNLKNRGIDVKLTNNSWGFYEFFSHALSDAISAHHEAGILFVAAAGNDNNNNDVYPAYPASFTHPNIIAVAATDHNDQLAVFSNYGVESVDVAAGGVYILSTIRSNGYDLLSGTSMATPYVSGLAALIWAKNPCLNHLQVKDIILNNVDPIPALNGKVLTGGRINAHKSLLNTPYPFYRDSDGDGYGNPNEFACSPLPGYVQNGLDCNDNRADIHPGAPEICDGVDNNCDGVAEVISKFYRDSDGDGYGNPLSSVDACSAPPGYVGNGLDCDDNRPDIRPNVPEICDGVDNDCDGAIDEGLISRFYRDKDGDNYGDPSEFIDACSAPPGYVGNGLDCDDNQSSSNPAATEICDGIDNDCDGEKDEGLISKFYRDSDGDGYGNPLSSVDACSAPSGYVSNGLDCDDTRQDVHPDLSEVCDGIDNDCDGEIDEGLISRFYRDMDGDGYGDPSNFVDNCTAPPGYVVNNLDCNEAYSNVHPGAQEVCDGIDNDCNGLVDDNDRCRILVKSVCEDDTYEPNDFFDSARELGSSVTQINAKICPENFDYYKISIGSPGILEVVLTYPSDKDFGLELYDNQRQQVGDLLSEETPGGLTRKKTISYSVSPGVYYIKVYSFSTEGSIPYTLSYSLASEKSRKAVGCSCRVSESENVPKDFTEAFLYTLFLVIFVLSRRLFKPFNFS
jgi:subtilisin family serine protease